MVVPVKTYKLEYGPGRGMSFVKAKSAKAAVKWAADWLYWDIPPISVTIWRGRRIRHDTAFIVNTEDPNVIISRVDSGSCNSCNAIKKSYKMFEIVFGYSLNSSLSVRVCPACFKELAAQILKHQ